VSCIYICNQEMIVQELRPKAPQVAAIVVRAPQSQSSWPRAGAPPLSDKVDDEKEERTPSPFTVEQFFRFSSLKFSPNKSTNEIIIDVRPGPC
jgi:hypothetical protein